MLTRGRPDLPGPLCQWSIGWGGGVLVHTAGRANHAGRNRRLGDFPAGDGNAHFLGCEVDTNGTQSMGPAQYEALVIGTAAIHKHMHWGHDVAYRHEDTSITGKWDLGSISTSTLQAAVRLGLQEKLVPVPATHAKGGGGLDHGPRGIWPFGVNHKLGPSRGNPTWHDGARPGERAAILQWQAEISVPLVGRNGLWHAANDAEMKRRTKTWQKAVGLLPTGYPGMAEWNVGTRR
jgi:hypothetical protein